MKAACLIRNKHASIVVLLNVCFHKVVVLRHSPFLFYNAVINDTLYDVSRIKMID